MLSQKEEDQKQTAALVRIVGTDEQVIRAELDKIRARQEKDGPARRITPRRIYGETEVTRRKLADFDEQGVFLS